MAVNRYLRGLLRRARAIWDKVDWFLWLGTLGLLYFTWGHGEVPWIDLGRVVIAVALSLAVGFFLLWHRARRRLSNGFVGFGSEPKVFSDALGECEGAYLFVGKSFKPHLDTFVKKYRPDASGKKSVSLVLAGAEHDAELAKEHLEVIEALKAFKIEYRTLERPRVWWAHVFNNQDEGEVSILFGLNVYEGKDPSTVLELERFGNRYSFFEHFLSEAREACRFSKIKPVDTWSRDLKKLVSRENNQLR